jgi:pyruvate/2-oxoglutarate dehydrogenase complex dihydrolipoamide acyltransferase (E2) component
MRSPVHLPDLGCPSPRLSLWFVQVGDRVEAGDRLVEIVVEGATIDVPAPVSGRLVERHVVPDEPVAVGQVLGILEVLPEARG